MSKKDRLPPGQRLVEAFPVFQYGDIPEFDEKKWSFTVTGLAEKPLKLMYKEFLSLPTTELTTDFHCVTGWSNLDLRWKGVFFKTIASMTKPLKETKFVEIIAEHGYTANLPIAVVMDNHVMFAYGLGGKPLTREHGFPLRLDTQCSALRPKRGSCPHRPETCPHYSGCNPVYRTSQRHLSSLEGRKGKAVGSDQERRLKMIQNAISIETRNLSKVYSRGNEEILSVNNVSLRIDKGDFVSIIGPSGSGKTTLINLLGCLDNPSSGELFLRGRSIFNSSKRLSERELTKIRRETFGYIFQNFYLIPTLTVMENVILPLTFYRKPGTENGALKLLKLLGMDHRKDHLPGQISGGEMQRVAIARAMVNMPEVLLADEPTGNLYTKRSVEIVQVLKELNRSAGLTIVMVTHNQDLAGQATRLFEMRDGQIYQIENPNRVY
jgi:putative ABC transport system ATP-binding protein